MNSENTHKRRVRYSGTHPKKFSEKYKEHNPEKYAEENDLIVSNDTGLMDKVVKEVIEADPKSVSDYKSGKEKALMALFGKCMRELKGNCDPQVLKTVLIDAVNKL